MVVFNYLYAMFNDNNIFIFFIFKLNVRLRSFLFACVGLFSRPLFTNCSSTSEFS
ncbi:hypothetical protein Hanom_Chr16g01487361 [Helianthus anomalus]